MYDSILETDIYDIIYRHSYKKQASIFERLIKKHKPSGNRLLDMCCGTGAHLNIYKHLGYEITGVDLSKAMVDKARKRFESTEIIQGDMRLFSPDKKYDIITCHSFSILHNTTFNDLTKTFTNFFNSLEKGGVLIFDVLDKKADSPQVDSENPEEISIDPDSQLFTEYGDEFDLDYDVQWHYIENKGLFVISIHLRIDSEKGVKEIQETIDMGAFSIDEIIDTLKKIGFQLTAFSKKANTIKVLSSNETEAIIVAVKIIDKIPTYYLL